MRPLVGMGMEVMAAPAVLHHRVQHGRHREPVHQDHEAQARQVASVVGVQQGRGAPGEGGGVGRLLSVFIRTRKAPSPLG